jgi:hypothetical protein
MDLMRPDDLKKISNKAEMSKAQEYISRARKQEEEQAGLREAFMHREVGPEAYERVMLRFAERPSREASRFKSSRFQPATATTVAGGSTTTSRIGRTRSRASRRKRTNSTRRS